MKGFKMIGLLLSAVLAVGCASPFGGDNGGIPTAEQIQAAKEQLPDKAEEFQFSLNGQIFQYPMEVQDMLDAGWTIEKSVLSQVQTIPAYTTTTEIPLQKYREGEYASAKCFFTVENRIGMDVEIGGLSINKLAFHVEDHPTLILPQGITWSSTLEEVVSAYGIEEDSVVDVNGIMYVLVHQDGKKIRIDFDSTTRTISDITFN